MQVLAEAVRQAGALEATKTAGALRKGTLKTLLNDLRYQPNGDLVDPQIWIYQVVDGEFQQFQW